MKVYVAGPYTKGDVAQNVRKAIEVGNELINAGFSVFIPHLSHFQHMLYPRSWKEWMKHDLEWLKSCDILYRIPGDSVGADIEVNQAKDLGMTVWTTLDKLLEFGYKENKDG